MKVRFKKRVRDFAGRPRVRLPLETARASAPLPPLRIDLERHNLHTPPPRPSVVRLSLRTPPPIPLLLPHDLYRRRSPALRPLARDAGCPQRRCAAPSPFTSKATTALQLVLWRLSLPPPPLQTRAAAPYSPAPPNPASRLRIHPQPPIRCRGSPSPATSPLLPPLFPPLVKPAIATTVWSCVSAKV
jgi:hypothetical protein